MTEAELKAIEARADAATKGPWKIKRTVHMDGGLVLFSRRVGPYCVNDNAPRNTPRGKQAGADCEFAAHSRTDIPALCAEVRRLRAEYVAKPAMIHVRDEMVEQHVPCGSIGIITGSKSSRAVTKGEVDYLTAADVKDNK